MRIATLSVQEDSYQIEHHRTIFDIFYYNLASSNHCVQIIPDVCGATISLPRNHERVEMKKCSDLLCFVSNIDIFHRDLLHRRATIMVNGRCKRDENSKRSSIIRKSQKREVIRFANRVSHYTRVHHVPNMSVPYSPFFNWKFKLSRKVVGGDTMKFQFSLSHHV